jgi:hypothetical protein
VTGRHSNWPNSMKVTTPFAINGVAEARPWELELAPQHGAETPFRSSVRPLVLPADFPAGPVPADARDVRTEPAELQKKALGEEAALCELLIWELSSLAVLRPHAGALLQRPAVWCGGFHQRTQAQRAARRREEQRAREGWLVVSQA